MESSEVDLLFPTPVYKTKLEENDDLKLIKNHLEYFEYYDYDNALGTKDQNVLKNPLYKNLREKVEDHLNRFLFDILKIDNLKVAHCNSWINKFQKGHYTNLHQHGLSFFSGVLYLKVYDGDCGDIIFHKKESYNTLSTLTFGCEFSEKNKINSYDVKYKPEDRLLLIFPSHLNHMVTVNNCDSIRYSLAFNYFIDGNLGVDTQRLNLKIY